MMIIGIDVDSVVADLDKEWFRRYNRDYDDNLTHDDVDRWATHELVKPECGYKIYDYLKDPTLYDNVKPIENSLQIIVRLRELGHRIIYITTTPIETPGVKFNWLVRYKYLNSDEQKNYFEAKDKSIFNIDILLDDNAETIANFPFTGVVFDAPWNRFLDWKYRVTSWNDFYERFIKGEYDGRKRK